jgi:hypothetical protein
MKFIELIIHLNFNVYVSLATFIYWISPLKLCYIIQRQYIYHLNFQSDSTTIIKHFRIKVSFIQVSSFKRFCNSKLTATEIKVFLFPFIYWSSICCLHICQWAKYLVSMLNNLSSLPAHCRSTLKLWWTEKRANNISK